MQKNDVRQFVRTATQGVGLVVTHAGKSESRGFGTMVRQVSNQTDAKFFPLTTEAVAVYATISIESALRPHLTTREQTPKGDVAIRC